MKNAGKSIETVRRSRPDDRAQYKRFLEAARDAEADETEEGADRAFKKIVSSDTKRTPRSRS